MEYIQHIVQTRTKAPSSLDGNKREVSILKSLNVEQQPPRKHMTEIFLPAVRLAATLHSLIAPYGSGQ